MGEGGSKRVTPWGLVARNLLPPARPLARHEAESNALGTGSEEGPFSTGTRSGTPLSCYGACCLWPVACLAVGDVRHPAILTSPGPVTSRLRPLSRVIYALDQPCFPAILMRFRITGFCPEGARNFGRGRSVSPPREQRVPKSWLLPASERVSLGLVKGTLIWGEVDHVPA
jgi:hypothetical protein